MITYLSQRKDSWLFRLLSATSSLAFLATLMLPPTIVCAQAQPPSVLNLPVAGTMVLPTPGFAPALIKGLTVHPENPLAFDFIVDTGDSKLTGKALEDETSKLVRYFLATLTTPEENLWVNLSPYEKDRIIPDKFGETEMGRDLLAQDYILKQLMASMMYPEDGLGKEFWNRVYTRAQQEFGTIKIPINTFNKVWIIPDEAVVVEYQGSAFVAKGHLKVMLEHDYLAAKKGIPSTGNPKSPSLTRWEGQGEGGSLSSLQDVSRDPGGEAVSNLPSLTRREGQGEGALAGDSTELANEIIRNVLIPEIEKEVNQGKNFAQLRQIYNSMILATWYKKNLKESLLSKVYVDKNKIKGVDVDDKEIKQKIYGQYVEAFKIGVYNYIKKDVDPATQKPVARKYFSGGAQFGRLSSPSVLKQYRVSSPEQLKNLSPAIRSGLRSSSPVARVEAVLGESPEIAEALIQGLLTLPDGNLRNFVVSGEQREEWAAKIDLLLGRAEKFLQEVEATLAAAKASQQPGQGKLLKNLVEKIIRESKVTAGLDEKNPIEKILIQTFNHYLNNKYFSLIGLSLDSAGVEEISRAQEQMVELKMILEKMRGLKDERVNRVLVDRGQAVNLDMTLEQNGILFPLSSSPAEKTYYEILGFERPVPSSVIVKAVDQLFSQWQHYVQAGEVASYEEAAKKISTLSTTPEAGEMVYNALCDAVLNPVNKTVVNEEAQKILEELPIYRKEFNRRAREAFLNLAGDLQAKEELLAARAAARRVQLLTAEPNKGAVAAVYYGNVPGFSFLYDQLEAELKEDIRINGQDKNGWISDDRFDAIVQRILAKNEYLSGVKYVLSTKAGEEKEGRVAFELYINRRKFSLNVSSEEVAARNGYPLDFVRLDQELRRRARQARVTNQEGLSAIADQVFIEEKDYEQKEAEAIRAVTTASADKARGRELRVSKIFQELLNAGPWQYDKAARVFLGILKGEIEMVSADDVISQDMLEQFRKGLVQAHQWEWMEFLVEEILFRGKPQNPAFSGLDDFADGLVKKLGQIERIDNLEEMEDKVKAWADGEGKVIFLPTGRENALTSKIVQREKGHPSAEDNVVAFAKARAARAGKDKDKGPSSSPAEIPFMDVALVARRGGIFVPSLQDELVDEYNHHVEIFDPLSDVVWGIGTMEHKPDVIMYNWQGDNENLMNFLRRLSNLRNGQAEEEKDKRIVGKMREWGKKRIKVIIVSALQEVGAAVIEFNERGDELMEVEFIERENNPNFDIYQVLVNKVNDFAIKRSSPSATSAPGGINLDPSLMNLQIKRDENWVPLPIDQQPPVEQMNIEGFYPVIINVTPLPALPILLGLDAESDDNPVNKVSGKQNLSWLNDRRTSEVLSTRVSFRASTLQPINISTIQRSSLNTLQNFPS